ncbi:DUF3263 domain-containing protein [Arcanobacterium canis]
MRDLTEAEVQLLEVERGWHKASRSKEAAIREMTGLSPFVYYLRLARAIEEPAFYMADPVLVDRLRRLQEKKLRERRRC